MKAERKKKKALITVILLVMSVALIVTGLVLKQNGDVFSKAIKICVECIGLGK